MARTPARKSPRRKKTVEARGLTPSQCAGKPPGDVGALVAAIEADGGQVLAPYREPLGGHWVVLAVLPIEKIEPTPYQRGLSETHVKRLTEVIRKTDRFLDPVITVRVGEGRYHTPNGNHRLNALRSLGARAITALVATEPEVERLILALNCEKAHNLREKCLEVIKLAQDLARLPGLKESELSLELEEPAFVTLGLAYLERPRLAAGAYHPLVRRVDRFLEKTLSRALEERGTHVKTLLEIDDLVTAHIAALRARGLESPYLRAFVVARCNPLRFAKETKADLEEALARMKEAARKLDPAKIKFTDIARTGGAPAEEG